MKTLLKNCRPLCDALCGEMYSFDGCMAYLMECLGEPDAFDYLFFAGVTGDVFTPLYSRDPHRFAVCLSDACPGDALDDAFAACGYAYERFTGAEADADALSDRICASLGRGLPVLVRAPGADGWELFGVICGWEDGAPLILLGEDETPRRYIGPFSELIFVGGRRERPAPAEVYRRAVLAVPARLRRASTAAYSFGRRAFDDWADALTSGALAAIPADDPIWYTHDGQMCGWRMHTGALQALGCNGMAESFLARAKRYNPDMPWLGRLMSLVYRQCVEGFAALVSRSSGFAVRPEALRDPAQMQPAAEQLRKLAVVTDEWLAVYDEQGLS